VKKPKKPKAEKPPAKKGGVRSRKEAKIDEAFARFIRALS